MHLPFANLTVRPILALFAFAAWAMFLVGIIGLSRVSAVLRGKRPANGFPSGVPHGSDAYWRLNRAHANALENLPIFAAIILGGAALGVSSERIACLSEVVVLARIAQSAFHIVSGAVWAVNLRFTAFLTQMVCMVMLIIETLRRFSTG